jgi:uracil-DNA glycosylase
LTATIERSPGPCLSALAAFMGDAAFSGWGRLPFFATGEASRICAMLDQRLGEGRQVLPPPGQMFAALTLCPMDRVRVVILGQDPYPTPGHANGLAFSRDGEGPLPASLKRIFRELGDDLGCAPRRCGDLSDWARQGVLLLNTSLSVEAGQAGSHLALGWQALARQVVIALATAQHPVVFILWGDKARAYAPLIGPPHLLIESAHPSPLAARGDFIGSRPFSRANAFLASKGLAPIDWTGAP